MEARGLIGPQVWKFFLSAVPPALAGSYWGQRMATRMPMEQYARLIFLLLFIMGGTLCWPALRMLLAV